MSGVPSVAAPSLAQVARLWVDPVRSLKTWPRRHGDLFALRLPAVGRLVMVGDPWAAHDVIRSDLAAALAWAVERLVREPAVLTRLEESLAAGDQSYLEGAIRGVLRWRPPVVDIVRELTAPMEIAGHLLEAGNPGRGDTAARPPP